jgi:Mechanosensitive ion channel
VLRRYPLKGWVIGILAGLVTLAALVVGSMYGDVHAETLNPKLVSWISAAVIVGAGILATTRLSTTFSHTVARGAGSSFEGAVKFISAGVGYLFVAFSALTVLDVSVQRLLVGAGLAGVVLGIAAQQSLGNIFAGLVLIFARPFVVGDHIRIRSAALGGILDVWVLEMSLTYVTVRADDGVLKIPNTAMLAAGVGKLPLEPATPETTPTSPTRTSSAQAVSVQPGLVSNDGGQAAPVQPTGVQSLVDQAGDAEGATSQNPQSGAKARRARLSRPRPSRASATRVKANVEDSGPLPPAPPGGPEPPA